MTGVSAWESQLLTTGLEAALPTVATLYVGLRSRAFSFNSIARRSVIAGLSRSLKVISEALGVLDNIQLPSRVWIALPLGTLAVAVLAPFFLLFLWSPKLASASFVPTLIIVYSITIVPRGLLNRQANLELRKVQSVRYEDFGRMEAFYQAGRCFYFAWLSAEGGFFCNFLESLRRTSVAAYLLEANVSVGLFLLTYTLILQLTTYQSFYKRIQERLIVHFLDRRGLRVEVEVTTVSDSKSVLVTSGELCGLGGALAVKEPGGWQTEVPWKEIDRLRARSVPRGASSIGVS